MSAIALAEALPDFGSTRNPSPLPDAHAAIDFADEGGGEEERAADEAEEKLAAAQAALREELESRHEQAMAAERERHMAEVQALQEQLGRHAAELIGRASAELEVRLTELTTSLTARILGTALTDDLQRRAVEALSRTIREALADREMLRVAVRGAPHMFEALKEALGQEAGHLEFTEGESLDLTVSIDGKLYETRLSEWSAALSGILA